MTNRTSVVEDDTVPVSGVSSDDLRFDCGWGPSPPTHTGESTGHRFHIYMYDHQSVFGLYVDVYLRHRIN